MEITQVRVFPVEEDKLKAFVAVIFDDCFVVSDIKIIEGNQGLFISMPSKRRKNGTFRDIAHPLNNETRSKIEERIIESYREVVARHGDTDMAPIRGLGRAHGEGDRQGDPPATGRLRGEQAACEAQLDGSEDRDHEPL